MRLCELQRKTVTMGCTVLTVFTVVAAFFISWSQCDIVQRYISYRLEAECQLDVCDDATLPVDNGETENKDPSLYIPIMMPTLDQCCTKCYCDGKCGWRGDCCPDYNGTTSDHNVPIGGLYRCTHTNLKKERGLTYRMVSRCLNNFTDDEVRKKCTNESASALEYFLPVSNNSTNETYRNVFCAMCNFENTDFLTPWKVNLSCSQDAPSTISLTTLARDILNQDGCNLYFEKPKALQIDSCRDVYDSCNLTGLWPVFDQEIVDACEYYKAEFDAEYRNIFCYLCNRPTDKLPKDCVNSIRNQYRPPFPFSVLFDFNSVDEVVQAENMVDKCPTNAVYNAYLGTCHVIHCDIGFIYEDEECKPKIKGRCIDAYLLFATSTSIYYHDIEVIRQALERTLEDSLNISAVALWDVHNVYYDRNLTFFVLHCRFSYQQDFAQKLIELTKEKIAVSYSYFSKYQNQEELIYFDVTVQDNIPRYELSADLYDDKTVMHAFEIEAIGKADRRAFKNSSIDECSLYAELTPMTQFTACPWIEVVLKDFNVSVSESNLTFWDMGVILSYDQFNFKSQSDMKIVVDTDVIIVCVHDFLKSTQENKFASIIQESNSESLGYLTLTTSVLSIFSALFTLITYATFRSLRTQPGINNMILAIHILFGHCFFLMGIRQHFSTVLCSIIGAVSHFCWLSVVLWYFVCSYHMSRVFRFSGNVLHTSIPKRTIKYTFFVSITSLSIMTINVISSLIFTNNGFSGYGDDDAEVCWISRPLFVALTMTLPTLLAVLCNIALFIYTLREIRQRSEMNIRSNKNRQTFLIYIKLSALTGITWLAIIPYIFTRLDIFNYIFTCLHGCNGVFLMAAFTLNRRVFSLYKSLCVKPGKKEQSSGRTTFSS